MGLGRSSSLNRTRSSQAVKAHQIIFDWQKLPIDKNLAHIRRNAHWTPGSQDLGGCGVWMDRNQPISTSNYHQWIPGVHKERSVVTLLCKS
eukprot:4026210-Amphidinium_carterae.1